MEEKAVQGNGQEEQPTARERARQDFKKQILMQMRSMGMPAPSKDPTDEELDGMIRKRMEGLENTITDKEASMRVDETYLARVAANRDVLINVDLKEAENEWHKKAVQAEIDELQAIIDEKKIKCDRDRASLLKLQKEMEMLKGML